MQMNYLDSILVTLATNFDTFKISSKLEASKFGSVAYCTFPSKEEGNSQFKLLAKLIDFSFATNRVTFIVL